MIVLVKRHACRKPRGPTGVAGEVGPKSVARGRPNLWQVWPHEARRRQTSQLSADRARHGRSHVVEQNTPMTPTLVRVRPLWGPRRFWDGQRGRRSLERCISGWPQAILRKTRQQKYEEIRRRPMQLRRRVLLDFAHAFPTVSRAQMWDVFRRLCVSTATFSAATFHKNTPLPRIGFRSGIQRGCLLSGT